MNRDQTENKEILSRRAVLQSGALLGAGVAASVVARSASAQNAVPKMAAKSGDLTILQFALTLERMEQSLYTQAVETDKAKQYLHGRLHEIVPVLRDNETAHVAAISAAITSLGAAPDTSARFRFPREVFISPITFMRFAQAIEEIGIGAYLGAVGQIDSAGLRGAAASIYGNETRHVALLRHMGGFPFSPRYYEGALSVAQVQKLITPYIA